uniref:Delta(14)-sterol reductase n=2 Tax=Hirondellea gigas TaxID=1518452 RepID=A0A6A7G960_9CRUS
MKKRKGSPSAAAEPTLLKSPESDRSSLSYEAVFVVIMIALIFILYWLWICITYRSGLLWIPDSPDQIGSYFARFWDFIKQGAIPSRFAIVVYLGWVVSHAFGQIYLSGKTVKGLPMRGQNGKQLKYTMNGWKAFWLMWIILFGFHQSRILPITVFYDLCGELMTVSFAFSSLLSLWLFLFPNDNSPTTRSISGFWFGRDLNPRFRGFDWKLFCEARPGLPLWAVLNVSTCVKQYETFGSVSSSMLLITFMQFWYVVDYFWNEEAILSTMDIMTDHFGFMLCFGDLAWVPFTYTIQTRFLCSMDSLHEASPLLLAASFIIFVVGFIVFRSSNSQKHNFRMNPSKHQKKGTFIETKSGSRLLISGWWGWVRHANYLGDIMMGWSWSLPTGYSTLLAYFYPIYFTILVLHREYRDNVHCQKKYGDDWTRYCKIVPYRLIPYVY